MGQLRVDYRCPLSIVYGLGAPEGLVDKSLDSLMINQFILEARFLHFATEGVGPAGCLPEDRISSDGIILFIVYVW